MPLLVGKKRIEPKSFVQIFKIFRKFSYDLLYFLEKLLYLCGAANLVPKWRHRLQRVCKRTIQCYYHAYC